MTMVPGGGLAEALKRPMTAASMSMAPRLSWDGSNGSRTMNVAQRKALGGK